MGERLAKKHYFLNFHSHSTNVYIYIRIYMKVFIEYNIIITIVKEELCNIIIYAYGRTVRDSQL